MKRRIATIAVVAMLSVCLISAFVGCVQKVDTEEGIKDLNECIEYTYNLEEYYLRVVEITPNLENALKSEKIETTLNINENAAKILKKTKDEDGNPINIIKIWGDSLKKGVKAKKATEEDWKKSVVWANEPNSKDQKQTLKLQEGTMTLDEFKSLPEVDEYGMHDIMDKVKEFVDTEAGQNPDNIKREGKVVTYTYNNIGAEAASIFGDIAVDDNGNYPLTIETVHTGENGEGYVSKVADKDTNGKLRYYVTMVGPIIKVPSWE